MYYMKYIKIYDFIYIFIIQVYLPMFTFNYFICYFLSHVFTIN